MTQRMLYILTPGNNISPFDVTLAADAGFSQLIPVTGIDTRDVQPIVQDAIFCRPPKRFNDTAVFIGGRDVHLATDMFNMAKNAMVGDFSIGVFADPNGAYTTSGAVLALVANGLEQKTDKGLAGRKVSVLGTGPVGLCCAILAAQQGAEVNLCALTADDDDRVAKRFCERYKVDVAWQLATTTEQKIEVMKDTEVMICAAKAGIRILGREVLEHLEKLVIVADTNAVPPSGVEGVGMHDDVVEETVGSSTFYSIGPLVIGDLKYKTQYGLFQVLQESTEPAVLDFPEAYKYALGQLHGTVKKAA